MKKRNIVRMLMIGLATIALAVLALSAATLSVSAEAASEPAQVEQENDSVGTKAIAAGIAVGVAAAAGAIGMGIAIAKSAESMARQPEASGKINSAMMLGLVFIETAIIYSLVVAILIIFVL